MKLYGLGYIGVTAADPAAMKTFLTDIVGMMPSLALPGEGYGNPAVPGSGPASNGSGVAADGTVYLKMDDRQWRVAVHQGDGPGIAYLGFELEDDVALAAAVAEVATAGVAVTLGTAEDAAARGVQALAWCTDPSGHRVELFHGAVNDRHFVSPTQSQFVTGALGLGHVLLFVADLDAHLRFYRGVLGFKRSDLITLGPGMTAHFLRCTPRHHTVGMMHLGPFDAFNHLMVEMTSLDLVGQALDRANAADIQLTRTLGRHLNDLTVSFYMQSPAGFEVEIGYDGVLVDDATWTDREAAGGEIWGHQRL